VDLYSVANTPLIRYRFP